MFWTKISKNEGETLRFEGYLSNIVRFTQLVYIDLIKVFPDRGKSGVAEIWWSH